MSLSRFPLNFEPYFLSKRALLNAVFPASTETLISFCKEQRFFPAVTAVLHAFGSDLERHAHIYIIISAGGLRLSGKAERYTRFEQRKRRDPKAKIRKVSVLTDNPEWIPRTKFPYKMLQKRYQSLLIKHLKEQINRNINAENPDQELTVFSDPAITNTLFDDLKEDYQNGFFVHIAEERTDLKLTAAYIGRYARRPTVI